MENNDYVKKLSPNAERRFNMGAVEFEKREDGTEDSNVISGYAAVFNKDSEDFGGWIERIAPGAFDEVLKDNAYALFNHSINHVLGRNLVNAELKQDDTGLHYRIVLPDTATANEVRTLIKDKIIDKSSFAFTVRAQEWEHPKEKNSTKPSVRTIKKVAKLYDISPVTYPAYPDTSVGARSFESEKPVEKVSDDVIDAIEAYINQNENFLQQQLND